MYKIYADNELIYDPTEEKYSILDGKLSLKLNSSGTLDFTIPRTNPSYGRIKLMKSIITLYEDDRILFRGRAYNPSINLLNNDTIECEGELAFFNDSIMPPYQKGTYTIRQLLEMVIENHNSKTDSYKHFSIGNITVTGDDIDEIRISSDYISTWKILRDKFLKVLGGYFYLRRVNGTVYLDYLKELDFISNQKVEQFVNLIDAKREIDASNFATRVIPLGAKIKNSSGEDTGEYVTIESLTGKNYLENSELVDDYGKITKIMHHENITTPQALLKQGKIDLADVSSFDNSITLSAVDLSKAGYDFDSFLLGTKIQVNVEKLNINTKMLVRGLSIDLLRPESNKISLGKEGKTISGWNIKTTDSIENTYNTLKGEIKETEDVAVVRAVREANSNMEQTANEIRTEVSESYYNKEKSDELLEDVRTIITQTKEAIEFNFNQYKQIQGDINSDTQSRFIEIHKYIRFVNGNILLGEETNPLTLRIENDRIVFLENGVDIAYWRNRKFYAVDGEFLNSLKLGKFAFIPRATGNLSFTKVEE